MKKQPTFVVYFYYYFVVPFKVCTQSKAVSHLSVLIEGGLADCEQYCLENVENIFITNFYIKMCFDVNLKKPNPLWTFLQEKNRSVNQCHVVTFVIFYSKVNTFLFYFFRKFYSQSIICYNVLIFSDVYICLNIRKNTRHFSSKV